MEIKSVRELKELVELFGVIKADSNSVVSCNETANELSDKELIKVNENKFKEFWKDASLYKMTVSNLETNSNEIDNFDSCTKENAKKSLDIVNNNEQSNRKKEAYKTYLGLENSAVEKAYKEFYKEGNGKLDAVSKGKDTNELECTCFICSKKIKNKELFKMPFLIRDYLNSKTRVENIEICEKCLDANSWVIRKKKKHEKLKSGC